MTDHRAEQLQLALGIRFRDQDLLQLALKHASFSDSRLDSNERLEFLGDAVLGLLACERIFQRYPDLLEGEMTKIKSAAVSRKTCADIAADLALDQFLVLGKGMLSHDELPRSMAAAVLESVIGALYLDQGLDAVRAFLLPLLDPRIETAQESGHQHNYKSLLQQHAQQRCSSTPCYRVLDERGPDHAKSFCIAVELAGQSHPPAWGNSKKQAEQAAAKNALTALRLLPQPGDSEALGTDAALASASDQTERATLTSQAS